MIANQQQRRSLFRLGSAMLVLALSMGCEEEESDAFRQFSPPAYIDDFDAYDRPRAEGEAFRKLWSEDIISSWTDIAIVGNPWQNKYDHQRWMYFNPLGRSVPDGAVDVTPLWIAFPHRVTYFAGQAGYKNKDDIYHFGDYGTALDGTPLPCIPPDRCSDQPAEKANPDGTCSTKGLGPWNPLGPRGWLDEYCEWSVKRDGDTLVAINFTCENPEYWNSVWTIDPTLVREIIEDLVNWGRNKIGTGRKKVLLEDLYLRDGEGAPVIDPQTGRPAYDTLNKWNRGTHTLPDSGGAIHLTSPPNSLGAEIYLAAAATILRTDGNTEVPAGSDPNPVLAAHNLVCAGRFGGVHRGSDPHIGDSVNQVVRALGSKFMVTLTDPVGLYIHQPEFSRFELPKSAKGITIEDCWNIVRGKPGMALHVVFQVPEGQDFSINDIKVDGKNIRYAGQIAETFKIGLTASAWPIDAAWPPMQPWPPAGDYPGGTAPPAPQDFPSINDGAIPEESGNFSPQASQPIVGKEVFLAQSPIRPQLAFSTPRFAPGSRTEGYVLPASNAVEGATVVAAPGSGVQIEVIGFRNIPEQEVGMLELVISVDDDAPPGLVSLTIRNPANTDTVTPARGLLRVLPR